MIHLADSADAPAKRTHLSTNNEGTPRGIDPIDLLDSSSLNSLINKISTPSNSL